MSTFNTSLSYHNSSSYPSDTGGNEGGLNTDTGGLHSRAREKYPNLLRGSGVAAEASPTGEFAEGVERIAYRATSNYFARVLNLPKDPNGKISVDKDTVLRHFDWKNERVADYTVDSIFDDVIGQVAAERSRRGQGSRSNVKVHPDLTASKFTADKGDYASRLDQMIQSIGGPELLEALRKASELITSQMDEDEEDSDSDISSPNMRAPDMPPAPSVPTSARPVIGSAKAAGASQGSSKAGASSGASSASSAEAQAAQEKIAKALESGGDDLVSLSENDELMKHASEEQKSEMIAKLQEHSDKKGKCDSRPEGNKADRAIANVMQSANDKSEFDNLMKAHGGQELLHSVEYGEAKQSLVQAAAAWGSNEFIDEKHQEKYSKEIAASQDLFLNPPDKSSKIQPPAVGSYGSDPTATGLERVESETNAYIADQAYTNLSPRAQREMLLMNAQRASEGKEAVDNTEVISEVERLRSRTLAQIEAGDEDSYKEQWEAWKQGLERIRKEHDMSEDAFRHTVTSRYENFYLGTNVSFGEPDSGEKDERSNEEKYHSYTRDEADLEQLREKYGQAPASAINGLDASSSLGATGVAGQAAQEELHKLLQEYEQAVAEEGFESRRAETLRQEIADLEESSSEYTADLNKIGVELDTLYQPPPADTFWLKFTEVFLAVAELAMTLAAAAFLGPAGVALISAGWAIYHATQKDWMAMAGSLAGGAVGGMGAASGAIAKSAAKGSQTGATLARGIGSKAATSTTKAAATTGAKSASSFSQNVSNLVAKTGKAGQFMGLNPSDDVLITTGKLTNMSQTTFETSYAASQGDALGAASSSLGLSQEGMNARRLTRLTQNSATAAVTTTYTVQAGQKFADGNYEGTFDLIGGVSNVGNLSGSNEHFKAGIGGVNEGLPTVDYSRSENLDTATADAPDKESSLSGSEEADAVESAEETKRTEAEEAERARVAKEVEQKRLTGRSSQVKVEQMLEDILGADVAKNIDAYYDPTMPEGQVRYTPDPDEQGKLQLSYGPKSNEQNIQWHVEHLDTLLQYNDNQGVGVLLPALSKPEAITLLEFDKHEKLIAKAQAVIADDTGEYSAVDKAMAKENLAFYEQEQAEIMQRISSEEHSHQLDTEGRRYVAGICLGKPKTSSAEGAVEPRAEAEPIASTSAGAAAVASAGEAELGGGFTFGQLGQRQLNVPGWFSATGDEGRSEQISRTLSHDDEISVFYESSTGQLSETSEIMQRIGAEDSNISFFQLENVPESEQAIMEASFMRLLEQIDRTSLGSQLLSELLNHPEHKLEVHLLPGSRRPVVGTLDGQGEETKMFGKQFLTREEKMTVWDPSQQKFEKSRMAELNKSNGVGTSSALIIDADAMVTSSRFEKISFPRDVTLFHELVHVLHQFEGTSKKSQPHQKTNREETSATGIGLDVGDKFNENSYRVEKELPLREKYAQYFFNSKQTEQIVEEQLRDILDAETMARIDVTYAPEMPVNGVEYTLPDNDSDKIKLLYGPSSNWMNIKFHARHLDLVANYNANNNRLGNHLPELNDGRAQFQLEYDLYSELIEDADVVINSEGTSMAERYMAEANKLMYQSRLDKLIEMTGAVDEGGPGTSSQRVVGRAIDSDDQQIIENRMKRRDSIQAVSDSLTRSSDSDYLEQLDSPMSNLNETDVSSVDIASPSVVSEVAMEPMPNAIAEEVRISVHASGTPESLLEKYLANAKYYVSQYSNELNKRFGITEPPEELRVSYSMFNFGYETPPLPRPEARIIANTKHLLRDLGFLVEVNAELKAYFANMLKDLGFTVNTNRASETQISGNGLNQPVKLAFGDLSAIDGYARYGLMDKTVVVDTVEIEKQAKARAEEREENRPTYDVGRRLFWASVALHELGHGKEDQGGNLPMNMEEQLIDQSASTELASYWQQEKFYIDWFERHKDSGAAELFKLSEKPISHLHDFDKMYGLQLLEEHREATKAGVNDKASYLAFLKAPHSVVVDLHDRSDNTATVATGEPGRTPLYSGIADTEILEATGEPDALPQTQSQNVLSRSDVAVARTAEIEKARMLLSDIEQGRSEKISVYISDTVPLSKQMSMKEQLFEILDSMIQHKSGRQLLEAIADERSPHKLEIMLIPDHRAETGTFAEFGKMFKEYGRTQLTYEQKVQFYEKNQGANLSWLQAKLPIFGASASIAFDPGKQSRNYDIDFRGDDELFHEMIHALHIIKGTLRFEEKHQATNREETSTVGMGPDTKDLTENLYRLQAGLPIREKYGQLFFDSKESEAVVKKEIEKYYKEDRAVPLDASTLERIVPRYNPKLPKNGVEYTIPESDNDKVVLSYGPSSNMLNILFHARHIDAAVKYNKQGAAQQDYVPNIDDDYRAQFQLEHDLYAKLTEYADEVIESPSSSELEKFIAEKNKAMYESRYAKLTAMMGVDSYSFSLNRVVGRAIDRQDENMINYGVTKTKNDREKTVVPREQILSSEDMEQFYHDKSQRVSGGDTRIESLSPDEFSSKFHDIGSEAERTYLIQNATNSQIMNLLEDVDSTEKEDFILKHLTSKQLLELQGGFNETFQKRVMRSLSRNQKISLIQDYENNPEKVKKFIGSLGNDEVDKLIREFKDPAFRKLLIGNLEAQQIEFLINKGKDDLEFIELLRRNLTKEQIHTQAAYSENDSNLREHIIQKLDPDEIRDLLETNPGNKHLIKNLNHVQIRDLILKTKISELLLIDLIQSLENDQVKAIILNNESRPKLTKSIVLALDDRQVNDLLLQEKDDWKLMYLLLGNMRENKIINHLQGSDASEDKSKTIVEYLNSDQIKNIYNDARISEMGKKNIVQKLTNDQLSELLIGDQIDVSFGKSIIGDMSSNQIKDLISMRGGQEGILQEIIPNLNDSQIRELLLEHHGQAQNWLRIIENLSSRQITSLLSGYGNVPGFQAAIIQNLQNQQMVNLIKTDQSNSNFGKMVTQSLNDNQVKNLYESNFNDSGFIQQFMANLSEAQLEKLLHSGPVELV